MATQSHMPAPASLSTTVSSPHPVRKRSLPFDVCEIILNFVTASSSTNEEPSDKRADLQNCALVSRKMRDMAYKKLYANFSIEGTLKGRRNADTVMNRFRKCAEIFQNSRSTAGRPGFGVPHFIKRFRLELDHVLASHKLFSNEGLISILEALHGKDCGILDLTLDIRMGCKEDPDYGDNFLRALKGLMCSNGLENLCIQGSMLFPNGFFEGKDFKTVTFRDLGLFLPPTAPETMSVSSGRNNGLSGMSPAFVQIMKTPPQTVHIHPTSLNALSTAVAVISTASKVEAVHIQLCGKDFNSGKAYDLSPLKCSTLQVTQAVGDNAIPALCSLLQQPFPSVDILNLEITMRHDWTVSADPANPSPQLTLNMEDCKRLDDALTQPFFMGIPQINLKVSWYISKHPEAPALDMSTFEGWVATQFRSALPAFFDAGTRSDRDSLIRGVAPLSVTINDLAIGLQATRHRSQSLITYAGASHSSL